MSGCIRGYLTNIIETSDEGTEDNDELIAQLNAVLQNGLAGSGEAQAAATKEETKEEKKPEGGDRRKYLSIPLADFEKNAISEAKAQGMHVYATTVYIQETCLLKAARAFLVFKGWRTRARLSNPYQVYRISRMKSLTLIFPCLSSLTNRWRK